jgi:hypothetical protein
MPVRKLKSTDDSPLIEQLEIHAEQEAHKREERAKAAKRRSRRLPQEAAQTRRKAAEEEDAGTLRGDRGQLGVDRMESQREGAPHRRSV